MSGGSIPRQWDACADTAREVPDGAAIIVGFDGSYSGDATAIIGLLVAPVPHLFVIGMWQPTGSDDQVDILAVEAALLEASQRFNVIELVADPFRWARSLQILFEAGVPVTNYPQTASRMSPATARFASAVSTRSLTHSG